MSITIETEEQYVKAMEAISDLMDSDPPKESEDGIRLSELATAIEAYEKKTFPLEALAIMQGDPIAEAIEREEADIHIEADDD